MNIVVDQDHIRVIDHALTAEFCTALIQGFHACARFQTRIDRFQHLSQLNLVTEDQAATQQFWRPGMARVWDWTDQVETLMQITESAVIDYRTTWDPHLCWPTDYGIEGFRMKHYRQNQGDHFPLHCDANSREMSQRFLGLLFYINDSDAATVFPQQSLTVTAQQGRLVIFPPGLQWPHQGLEPRQQSKYIISSYLHYL